jgi:hypothetical protein
MVPILPRCNYVRVWFPRQRSSNTFWDWNLNHVGGAYGMMDEVFKFAATLGPPRAFPPSFNPSTVLKETLDDIKASRKP